MRVVVRLFGVLVLACLLAGVQERAGEAPPTEAAFPGANGKIAFSRCGPSLSLCEIVVANSDGSGGNTIADGISPSWSPNGERLAYVNFLAPNQYHIYSIKADGTEKTKLTSDTGEYKWGPGWSPDGSQIVFMTATGIDVMDAQGTNRHAVINLPNVVGATARWSPDGEWIVATGVDGIDLVRVRTNGTGFAKLTNTPASSLAEIWPDWSPDGVTIAYSAAVPDSGIPYDIYLMDADGTNAHKIADLGMQPAWSPDGTKLLVTDPVSSELYTINADGSGRTEIPNTDGASFPSWQPANIVVQKIEFTQGIQVLQSLPELMSSLSGGGGVQPQAAPAAFPGDNGRLVYAHGCNSPFEIVTVDPDGTNAESIPVGNLNPFYVAASPEGSRIAFATIDGMVYVVNTDGSGLTQVTTGTEPAWSPDGTKLAVVRQGNSVSEIWVVGVDSSTPDLNVAITDAKRISPAWSPDGARIAYKGYAGEDEFEDDYYDVFLVDPTGGGEQNLTNSIREESSLSWSPDGTSIAAQLDVYDVPPDVPSLVSIDLAGGVSPLVNSESADIPRWSPDGTSLAYRDTGGLWTTVVGSGVSQIVVPVTCFHSLDWLPTASLLQVEFTQGIQQLQGVSTLQSDLTGDGKPPVPMIEGKAAAMRIYFAEVDQATDYSVEVSGEFSDNEIVNLTPGCTPTQRRAQTGGCSSVDFFFTPPEGNWSVRLVVKDILDQVVVDEEFSFTSVDMGELDVQYLPICVKLTTGAVPATCPTNISTGSGVTDLTEKLFPVAPNDFHYSRFPVPAVELAAPMTSWDDASALIASLRMRYNLMALGNLAPDQLAGWVPPGSASVSCGVNNTQTCNILGFSDPLWYAGTGRVSWQSDQSTASDPASAQFTLAHEIAHNYGPRHAATPDGCGAADAPGFWPYSDATIQEVGFDVATGTAVPATTKDLMSYCTPPVSNIWVSPHTYNRLVDSVFAPQGFGVSPAGAPIQQLIVKGSAQADGSAAMIESAYVITTSTPADQPNPLGNYCLRTSGGAALDYCFVLRFQEHQSGAPTDSESFSLRMPLPPGTTHVSLAKGFLELDALDLSPAAPSLDVTQPDELSGEGTIEWSASDADGDPVKVAIMYTPDGGDTWYPLAVDVTDDEFTFDSSVLEGDEILIRVLASDGLNTTVETTGPVTVIHGTARTWGDNNCSGTVDPVDSLLILRFDAALNTDTGDCPPLGHAIGVASTPASLWGDVDCTGDAGPVDSLKLLRFDAGLSVSQGAGCPTLGSVVSVSDG